MVNRTQALVLGLFLMALASLLVILLAAREVYDQGLIGLAQLAIGLAMLAGYRRSGVWGALERSDDLAVGGVAVPGCESCVPSGCRERLRWEARQVGGRQPGLRPGQAALGFTPSE